MNDSLFQPDRDQAQRAMNEAKKNELRENYGAEFHEVSPDRPPDVEGDFLAYIEEFERQFSQRRQTTVREFLGGPVFRPLAEISDHELSRELQLVLDLMATWRRWMPRCAGTASRPRHFIR